MRALCLQCVVLVAFPSAGSCQSGVIRFENVAESAGLNFRHHSPLTKERHLHLFMGSGVGWLDYDHDGLPDLYCSQGQAWPTDDDNDDERFIDQLFRNSSGGTFTEVTTLAGIVNFEYSMGVAAGDFDNDGFHDLFVSAFGRNTLHKNLGDGTWQKTTLPPAANRYAASSTWADIDNDGDLDLYVTNYLVLPWETYPLCTFQRDGETYPAGCHPRGLKHDYDVLFRNNSDGTFTNISDQAGLKSQSPRSGLGIVTCDFDCDGDLDFYIANDTVNNQLWVNDGTGRFADDALLTGLAVNRHGLPEAGMGVACNDVDGDGRSDLFVTNFFNETNTFYRNDGFTFTDVTAEYGLAAPSKQRLGFGTSLFDADNDGWLDLFVANGQIAASPELDPELRFAQLPQMFRNQSGLRFDDVSTKAGAWFQESIVGRSSAVADFDRDGDPDLAVQQLNGPIVLLQNESKRSTPVISFELTGTQSNRDGIGAKIEIQDEQRTIVRYRSGSTGYLSCDEHRLQSAIDKYTKTVSVTVTWLGGKRETWTDLQCGTVHYLVEGSGIENEQ